MALTGQTTAQLPQRLHSKGSILEMLRVPSLSSMAIARKGQASTQVPHPVQRLSSTMAEGVSLSTFPSDR